MPTITTDIDFEVICDECGTGLCSSTKVEGTTLYISPCPKCIAQKDYEINELKDKIDELENKINELENSSSHDQNR